MRDGVRIFAHIRVDVEWLQDQKHIGRFVYEGAKRTFHALVVRKLDGIRHN